MIKDKKLISLYSESPAKFYNALRVFLKSNRNDLYTAVIRIVDYYKNHKNAREVLAVINNVSADNHSPIALFFFYHHWCTFDFQVFRMEEARVVLSKMEACLVDNKEPLLEAEYLFKKAGCYQNEKAEVIFKKGLSLLKPGTNNYLGNVKTLLDEYSQKGRLRDLNKKYMHDMSNAFVHIFSFIDDIENGKIEEALKHEKFVFDHKELLPIPFKLRLKNLKKMINLYLGSENKDELKSWLLSTWALLNKDSTLALNAAKENYDSYIENSVVITSFDRFTLLRAELSNKNLAAAKWLLADYEKRNWNYNFMDFFYARMELLNNNPTKASEHFKIVMKTCRDYDAMGRLDFELELALELKPKQIRFLVESALTSTKKGKLKSVELIPLSLENKVEVGVNKIKGTSLSIISVKEEVVKYAAFDIPILILGETGVGKDVIANAIHEESKRKGHSFIAINCSAITESLLQSELFGHEAGAYSGATKAHKGIFEEAGKGTVFLDEIGDISRGMQVALLRVLESGEYRPVGSAKPRPIHCRIIAATNALLETRVDEGFFRKDLLFRLKRLVIKLPPLRERPKDIKYLSDYFLNFNKDSGDKAILSPELEEAFQNYNWPGNIRELKNEIEKMRLLHSEKSYYVLEDVNFLSLDEKKSIVVSIDKIPEKKEFISHEITVGKSEKKIFKSNGSYIRRVEAIKQLFKENKTITRKEIYQIIGAANITIGKDLKRLREEGFIKKVEPTKSPRTHYFILVE
ncbi:MAG: hypothetical protein COA79_12820 [Planctomycetota bacterium]|nr:MAG: hypothetical protein COA79_12820 [Planctomycetota bacterium]